MHRAKFDSKVGFCETKPYLELASLPKLADHKLLWLGYFTSSRLDELVDLMPSIHGAEVKEFDNRASLLQLRGIIRWWRELLEYLPAHTGSRLFLFHHRAVTEVALDKKLHFLVPDENIARADIVEPPLHQRLDPSLVLFCPGAS
jgi:hypothetical protein